MAEKYKNFRELSTESMGNANYKIELQDRGTDFVIVGIHGWQIEPGTENVVRAIAGSDISSYLFLGSDSTQHITSHNFDESSCIDLLSRSKKTISIHGKKGSDEFVILGGLDTELISKAEQALQESGFKVIPTTDTVAGIEPSNICNKGSSGKGLQIEMSRELRDSLVQDQSRMMTFAQIIRNLTR